MDRVDMSLRFKEERREYSEVGDFYNHATLPSCAAKDVPKERPHGITHGDMQTSIFGTLACLLEKAAHDLCEARADVAFLTRAQAQVPWHPPSPSMQSQMCRKLKMSATQNLTMVMLSELKVLQSAKEGMLRSLPSWIEPHLLNRTGGGKHVAFHDSVPPPSYASHPSYSETPRTRASKPISEVNHDIASGIKSNDAPPHYWLCASAVSDSPTSPTSWRTTNVHTSCPACKSTNIIRGHHSDFSYCAECSRPMGIAESPFNASQFKQEPLSPGQCFTMPEQLEKLESGCRYGQSKASQRSPNSQYQEQRLHSEPSQGFVNFVHLDYKAQLAVLEEQNTKRLLRERSREDQTTEGLKKFSFSVPDGGFGSAPAKRPISASEALGKNICVGRIGGLTAIQRTMRRN